MVLDPVHGKIDKFALAHKADCPVAEARRARRTFLLKSSANLVKVLAVDKECAVFLSHAPAVFHNCAMFDAVVFAGVLRTGVRQMQ